MIIVDCVQGTPEWKSARCGIPTASNFDMIITTKGDPSKQKQKYLFKLAGEKISGISEDTYQSDAMKRGIEMEEEARKLYQIITGNEVAAVGFCLSANGNYGASPDGMTRDMGCIEIKCPNMATHVEYLLDNKLPTEYFQQVQGQLLVTGCSWCDFMSYFPGIKPLVIRVFPDKEFIKKLSTELENFTTELNSIIERIK